MGKRSQRKRVAGGIVALLLVGVMVMGGSLWVSLGSRSDLIPIGQPAPDFMAQTSEGHTVRLSELREQKRVVLVFYPGDFTPVCTQQLCAFRDNWSALQSENAVVYGVNPADKEQHHKFAAQNRLPFPLLVDESGDLTARYGCRALFGIVKRTVYVIDRRGQVIWVKRGNPSPAEILRVLHSLNDTR